MTNRVDSVLIVIMRWQWKHLSRLCVGFDRASEWARAIRSLLVILLQYNAIVWPWEDAKKKKKERQQIKSNLNAKQRCFCCFVYRFSLCFVLFPGKDARLYVFRLSTLKRGLEERQLVRGKCDSRENKLEKTKGTTQSHATPTQHTSKTTYCDLQRWNTSQIHLGFKGLGHSFSIVSKTAVPLMTTRGSKTPHPGAKHIYFFMPTM